MHVCSVYQNISLVIVFELTEAFLPVHVGDRKTKSNENQIEAGITIVSNLLFYTNTQIHTHTYIYIYIYIYLFILEFIRAANTLHQVWQILWITVCIYKPTIITLSVLFWNLIHATHNQLSGNLKQSRTLFILWANYQHTKAGTKREKKKNKNK